MKTLLIGGTSMTFKARYSEIGGRLLRVEVPAAATAKNWEVIGHVVPIFLADLDAYKARWTALNYQMKATASEKKKTFLQELNAVWFACYFAQFGFSPKYTGADGKALKQIGAYLSNETGSEDKAVELFRYIFERWHELDTFTQGQYNLLQINSRLNLILQQLKTKQQGDGKGYNFREKIPTV